MSQPSRTQRRQTQRGTRGTPPPRDPMTPIYLGLGILLVLIFGGFGIWRWVTNEQVRSAYAYDAKTPAPAPGPTGKPIQLQNGETVGKPFGFKQPNIKTNILSDTAQGGQGQPVNGIPCEANEAVVVHFHVHLAIFDHGKQAEVPPYIGMAPAPPTGCLYWLHTHDGSGVVHIEAGSPEAPNGGHYTLGDFFAIWGYPLNHGRVGPFAGPVTAFVDGQPYDGKLDAIPFYSHEDITLEVGTPVVPPPNYLLPAGD